MGRKTDLYEVEKSLIIQNTAKDIPVKPIAKELSCHQRTIKRFLADPSLMKKRLETGSSKLKTDQNMCRICHAMSANLGKNRGVIFAAVGFKNVPKSIHNKVLPEMGKTYHPLKYLQ